MAEIFKYSFFIIALCAGFGFINYCVDYKETPREKVNSSDFLSSKNTGFHRIKSLIYDDIKTQGMYVYTKENPDGIMIPPEKIKKYEFEIKTGIKSYRFITHQTLLKLHDNTKITFEKMLELHRIHKDTLIFRIESENGKFVLYFNVPLENHKNENS